MSDALSRIGRDTVYCKGSSFFLITYAPEGRDSRDYARELQEKLSEKERVRCWAT